VGKLLIFKVKDGSGFTLFSTKGFYSLNWSGKLAILRTGFSPGKDPILSEGSSPGIFAMFRHGCSPGKLPMFKVSAPTYWWTGSHLSYWLGLATD
jgi:hypothetical protein